MRPFPPLPFALALMLSTALSCSTSRGPAPQPSSASSSAPAVEAEPGAEPVPVLGLELGLPRPPNFEVIDLPALATDGTWSIRGLRHYMDALLPEAEQGRVILVSAYVQEIYAPPVCPDTGRCPPARMPHAWLVDDPSIRGKADALMLTGTEFPIPEWDQQTQLEWADVPVPVLEVGKRYVFMGWFRRFTDSGFAHDHGLLELFALTDYPLGERPEWIAPPNSDRHPRVREAQGLPPLPERASIPAGVIPGERLPSPAPLVEPGAREHAQTLAIQAHDANQPRYADYYFRWLIVDDPDVAWPWVALANMYLDHGESAAGIEILDLAISRKPNDSVLHNGRGRFFLNLGQPAVAVRSYQRALELKPDAPDILFGLGMAYAELGERELAIETLERYLAVAGDGPAHVIRAAQDTIMRMQH